MTQSVQRRSDAIDEVRNAVCRDRCNTHGDAEDNFELIATVWTLHLRTRGLLAPGAALTALDAAHMQASMKLARASANMNHRDHWVDTAGYAVCGAGIYEAQSSESPLGDAMAKFAKEVNSATKCAFCGGASGSNPRCTSCCSTKQTAGCGYCGHPMDLTSDGFRCPNPFCHTNPHKPSAICSACGTLMRRDGDLWRCGTCDTISAAP